MERREAALEALLLKYIERYGLIEEARRFYVSAENKVRDHDNASIRRTTSDPGPA